MPLVWPHWRTCQHVLQQLFAWSDTQIGWLRIARGWSGSVTSLTTIATPTQATWQCHTMATHHKTSVEQLSFCLEKDVRVRVCVYVAVVTVAPVLVSNAKPDAEMQAARGG